MKQAKTPDLEVPDLVPPKQEPKYLGKFVSVKDLMFLQHVNQHWFRKIEKDMEPKYYLSGSFDTDIEIQSKLYEILEIPTL